MIGVLLAQDLFHEATYLLGVKPRSLTGIHGILTSIFAHGDWEHLLSNASALLFLMGLLFTIFPKVGFKSFLFLWIVSGLWTWCLGRESYHIGASGLVYALFSFLFWGGILYKKKSMIGLTLLIAFLYGSAFWGVFPMDHKISWEAHLSGFLAGTLAAFVFRKQYEKPEEPYVDPVNEEVQFDYMPGVNPDDPESIDDYLKEKQRQEENQITINYIIVPDKKDNSST